MGTQKNQIIRVDDLGEEVHVIRIQRFYVLGAEGNHMADPTFSKSHTDTGVTCSIEIYTDGERRFMARALARERGADQWVIYPKMLREVSGCLIGWTEPAVGEPISTSQKTGFNDLHELLRWWAVKTSATNAALFR